MHGENLGKAVSRGEIILLVTMPREPRPTPLNAVFVSERKISWCGVTPVTSVTFVTSVT